MNETAVVATTNSGIIQRIDRGLLSLPRTNLVIVLLLSQAALIYGDFLTGPWVPFGIFYLLSLFVAVKYLGVRTAYLMAFIIVCGKTYARVKMLPADVLWWQHLWQFISSYSIYTFFCYLINTQLSARTHAESLASIANNRAGTAERRLINISEETQQRIGRELHDDLGQHLTGIAFMAQVLSQKLKDAGHKESTDADRITLMLNQAISKTRDIAHGLYPSELEELGLRSMLEKFAGYIEATYPVTCSFSSDNNCEVENQETAIHLFRISQEAVNNAIKHGHATHIYLHMSLLPMSQVLEILDNGCGLDEGISTSSTGLGMRSMRYRTELIGATLKISSRLEGGTRVTLEIPSKQ